MQNKKTLFISDLHINENRPDIVRCFLFFLSSLNEKLIDSLYILGDLFESWIGDDDLTETHSNIMQALKRVGEKGIPIYFIHGNRDFLIGPKFLNNSNVKLLPEEKVINLYDKPILLMHGDTLCTKDASYLKARRLLRNNLLQKLFLTLPLFLRRKIAHHLRKKSQQHTKIASLEVMDVDPKTVLDIMAKHQVHTLIHGHTHRPDIHLINNTIQKLNRIVLGAWHEKGNVLVWNENGEKKLLDFTTESNLNMLV